MQHQDKQYMTIHSVKALESRQYSIVHANIDNTPEKQAIVKDLYPSEDWHIEYHNSRINVSFKIQ